MPRRVARSDCSMFGAGAATELAVKARPGELYVVQNFGNLVPGQQFDNGGGPTVSSIQYAINQLGVKHVIVSGHMKYRTVELLPKNAEAEGFSHWLEQAGRTRKVISEQYDHLDAASRMNHNEGWVNGGIDHDTARFAERSIRIWWGKRGSKSSPRARPLLSPTRARARRDPPVREKVPPCGGGAQEFPLVHPHAQRCGLGAMPKPRAAGRGHAFPRHGRAALGHGTRRSCRGGTLRSRWADSSNDKPPGDR